jgi:hypothetical protein
MSSTYSNLGIELIGTGEQAGTWGTTTNNNFSTIIDNAIVGYKAVAVTGTSSGSPTVLTVSDGSASDGQKRIIEATGSPASAGFLRIDPNDFAGYYFIRNSTTQTLNVFQGTYSAGNAVTIESGYDAIIRCNGSGAGAVVSFINYNLKTGNISANGTVTATALSGPHNGTVGATTPSTGAFTTLSASSTVSGTGFSTYLASPPAIGGTAAAAGSFTTLSASSTVSGTGFSTYLASPPAIGGTAAAAGSFTTLAASSTVSGTGFSTYLASPPAIGGTAAAAGNFTTLAASSTLATGGVAVGGYSFTSRSTATTNAYFVDTDSSATGMNVSFLKNSASPAIGDDIVNLRFYGNDSTAVQTEYVRLTATIADPTNASEDGTFSLTTVKAGALGERVRYTSADGFYIVDGAFRAPDVYASTTGTAANMVMSSASGILQRSTSSLRYKNSVADATYGLAEVMQLRPVTYKGNNDGDTIFGGFIAEEVHGIGLTQFVQYDAENRPDALAYGNMVSLLTKAMQEQQAVIEDLKARIAVLEAK